MKTSDPIVRLHGKRTSHYGTILPKAVLNSLPLRVLIGTKKTRCAMGDKSADSIPFNSIHLTHAHTYVSKQSRKQLATQKPFRFLFLSNPVSSSTLGPTLHAFSMGGGRLEIVLLLTSPSFLHRTRTAV